MKKSILLILILFISIKAFTQVCGAGNISLFGQSAVNNFVSTYSASGCTTIDGNLTIMDANNNSITNLSGLSFLTQINGTLTIQSSYLSTLNGLENIQTIAGDLIIRHYSNINNALQIIKFPSLQSIGGGIACHSTYIPHITEISFPVLTTVTKSINFSSPNVTATNFFNIYNLHNLTTLNFQSLVQINDYLTVYNCGNLETISLDSLQNVGSYLKIYNCSDALFTNLSFPALTTIADYAKYGFNKRVISGIVYHSRKYRNFKF